MTDSQRLVETLRRRIRAYLDDGDRLGLFEPRASADLAELHEFCISHAESVPVEVVETLAWLHWTRWQAMPEPRDLDIARALFTEIRDTFPELIPPEFRNPDRARWPYAGARVLDDLAPDADPAHLDTAIEMLEQGLAAVAPDDPHRGVHLKNLASGYVMRFDRAGAPGDLDLAVQAAVAALRTGSFAGSGADTFRETLEHAITRRYDLHHRAEDLDKIIDVSRARWQTAASGDPGRFRHAGTLAEALYSRYDEAGRRSDLDEAIAVRRAEITRERADFDEALAAFRAEPVPGPGDHLDRAAFLSRLGTSLTYRYTVGGVDTDLADAIAAHRVSVEMAPDRPAGLRGLAITLRMRFLTAGDPADLEESVRLARAAGTALRPGDREYGAQLTVLSQSLRHRFEHTGRIADLDEAVATGRSALENLPDDEPERVLCAVNLLSALRSRAIQRGELTDLNEAVEIGRAALAPLPDGHPHRPLCLSNLALALLDRFDAVADRDDIDEAVRNGRAAAETVNPADPDRQAYFFGLARILRIRYQDTEQPADLDDAVEAARTAVALAGADLPTRLYALGELSLTLHERWRATDGEADLEEAAGFARLAIDACPPGNPNRAGYLYLLGRVLQAQEKVDSAVDVWRDAVETASGPPRNRIAAARAWGAAAAGREQWPSARAGYAAAVELIPLQAGRGINRASQELLLADWSGLGADAAACAVHAGPPGEAAQLLEMGRNVLWGQLLETRTALTDSLRKRAPDLAERLDTVRAALDRPL
ncbi:tetratricopeptide (TPR) repeat protein [Actinoplanes campanulatus]|uniref:Tetratricopeptide (TPR) repeat protein n=1 Tax=Actinoplanes campanulatus TaxID=113559 RepID=A0A7W5FF36_9ACTN|nr:hypothetical protein [Actinoplanes campanulatus]MBB3096084.1 tetratricopeptide (TPR) repeat protein [Actinoplanes campanulatus]GGN13574.1 hypothetical protein GCM10010109_24680 [Actinoplanes campanulatus]GID36822.1 hypothetical protein Aca09nite_33280 [Actinoplanes campanulatus]